MTLRVQNRLLRQSQRRFDNYLEEDRQVDRVIQVEYMPCQKIFHYGVIPHISLTSFIRNMKEWVRNYLELDLPIDHFILSGMLQGNLLKVEEHFQTMEELRNVYYFRITPIATTDEINLKYIPRRSLHDVEDRRRILFKPVSGYNIHYFECVFKMDIENHKRRYNIIDTWTLQEFIQKVLEWFIRDCRLDTTKEYEIVSLDGHSLPLLPQSSIKNLVLSHPPLFPSFYIREKYRINDFDIPPIITPLFTQTIIQPIIENRIINIGECSVCWDGVANTRRNQYFQNCTHLLCVSCNNDCIRTRNISCPQCRGERRRSTHN